MKTFLVRAQKEKEKKKKNTFETWTGKRGNGFRENTSKKGEIKEKQKITVPPFDFFPLCTRQPFAHRPEMFIDEPFLLP